VDVQHKELKKPTPPRDDDGDDTSNSGPNPSASKKGAPSNIAKKRTPSSEFDLEAEVPVADDGKNAEGKSGEKATPSKKHMETASASEERKPDSRSPRDGTVDPRTLDPMPHYRKSLVYTKSGDYTRALKEVNRALYLNPHLISARYQGALLFQLQGRTAEAIKRYRDVLDLDPQYTVAHINLGICYRKMNELDDAEDEYRQALEQNFYSLPAHYNLATVLIQKDDLEGALKELKSCSKLAPNNAPVHNNLGVIYEKRHYLEEAEDEFLKAMTLDPGNEQFGRNLEHVRYKLKRKPVKA
jgi:tetratricopeptide (TPR) repeat protein